MRRTFTYAAVTKDSRNADIGFLTNPSASSRPTSPSTHGPGMGCRPRPTGRWRCSCRIPCKGLVHLGMVSADAIGPQGDGLVRTDHEATSAAAAQVLPDLDGIAPAVTRSPGHGGGSLNGGGSPLGALGNCHAGRIGQNRPDMEVIPGKRKGAPLSSPLRAAVCGRCSGCPCRRR